MQEYGFGFLLTQRCAPSADPPVLGALAPFYVTLATSCIAMLIAIPVALGSALFLTEICPVWLLRPIGLALGETVAVTFIIGNSLRISWSIFAPGTTIAAAIASEFAESDGLHQSALILLGLLLFVLTFFVLASARLMLLRLEKKAGN